MPAKTEEQRKLFALALSVKRGETSKKEVSKQVLKLAQDMSEDELSKMASKIKTEATTSASSGSYEAPFGLMKKDMNILNNMKENKTITLEQLEKIVKRTLIKEEVYSVKPSEFKPETPKVATTKSNINTKDKNKKSTSDKNTKKSGETANKSTKDSMKAVAESLKNNLKGSEKVENKNRMQNEDERIEAYQNGLSDLTYDNITPEKQKKNAEYLVNDRYMGQGNHQKTSVNQQILDDSKKRQKSRDDSKFNNITSFGSDTEFNPKPNLTKGKQLAYENKQNPMKSINFKTTLKDSKDVLNRIQNSKFPKHLKSNDMVFEMTDGENKYKIRWEGHSSTGMPIILEHRNDKKMKTDMEKMAQLGNYNPSKHGSKTSALNENEILKDFITNNRKPINEDVCAGKNGLDGVMAKIEEVVKLNNKTGKIIKNTPNGSQVNEDFDTSGNLKQISKDDAKQLFLNGIYIYIKTDENKPDSHHNLFMLNSNTWDGSLNIYKRNLTPIEYGFEDIVKWIEERVQYPLEFYTLNSNEPNIINAY